MGGEAICWGEIDHPPRSVAELEESLSRDELSNLYHAQRVSKGKGRSSTLNGGDFYYQISSGMKHACATTRDGEVHCWGRNDYGESTPPSGKFVHVSSVSLAFFDHCFVHSNVVLSYTPKFDSRYLPVTPSHAVSVPMVLQSVGARMM